MNTKGGVGKSSCGTGIAKKLSNTHRVRFIDVDICSSNTEQILNLEHKKAERIIKKTGYEILPRTINNNLKYMGINLLQEKESSGTQLKGTAQASLFEMMVKEVVWGKSDCCILDLPAGTDDIFLSIPETLGKSFKGIFIVTQPKTIIDCERVIELCGVHRFKILGVIENMVGSHCKCHDVPAICPICKTYFAPFGKFGDDGIRDLAKKFNLEYCGWIPLTDGDIFNAGIETFTSVSNKIIKEIDK
jgi:ATP-binding protein involved in chromosome partitioning